MLGLAPSFDQIESIAPWLLHKTTFVYAKYFFANLLRQLDPQPSL